MAATAPAQFTLTTTVSTIFDATTDGGLADIVYITNDSATTGAVALINVNGLQVGTTPAQPIPLGASVPFKRGSGGIDLITAKASTGTALITVNIAAR